MKSSSEYAVLKVENYENDGDHFLRFAVMTPNSTIPNILFIFDEYKLVETPNGIEAQCSITFSDISNDGIVPLTQDDPRIEQLFVTSRSILQQLIDDSFVDQSLTAK